MLGELFNRVAALMGEVNVLDAELGRDLRFTTRHIVAVVRLLEMLLVRFAELERRLEYIVAQIEERTGQKVDDELYEHLAGRVGILRVRSALERLSRARPHAPEQTSTSVFPEGGGR
jgi:tetrahydromethanopterin S-methyltransferase subunit G